MAKALPTPFPPFLERVPALGLSGVTAGFVGRVSGIDVAAERAMVLPRLEESHRAARQVLALDTRIFATAEQIHGVEIGVLSSDQPLPAFPVPGVDGLLTNRSDICLGIYVADCSAVYLVDPVQRAIGLVHSGRKGTELGIVPAAIQTMHRAFGTQTRDLRVHISPSIRPPWYATDFAAEIAAQCRTAGVENVHDDGRNTAAHPDLFYSYRREKGRTGRMLALLALV